MMTKKAFEALNRSRSGLAEDFCECEELGGWGGAGAGSAITAARR